MVMMTRSARKRACELFDDTSSDNTCNVPPWCSSGKAYDRKKPRKTQSSLYDIRSPFLPGNVWKLPCKDKTHNSSCSGKRRYKSCSGHSDYAGKSKRAFALVFVLASLALVYVWGSSSIKTNSKKEIIGSLGLEETSLALDEECCYKMKQLAAALSQAEQTLRRTKRHHTLMLTAQSKNLEARITTLEADWIEGAAAYIGSGTTDWGGHAALWGIVPLWRASPPPQTLLSVRRPTPGDCWPFSGSRGEAVLELPLATRMRRLSVEHVRPDAARSAPRHFALYGILENGTWVKALSGEYRYEGPAKQFFTLLYEVPPVTRLVFKVMSNHGNTKYTCVYRVHVYGIRHLIIDMLRHPSWSQRLCPSSEPNDEVADSHVNGKNSDKS